MSNVEEPVSKYGFAVYMLLGSIGYLVHGSKGCAIALGSAALIRLGIAHFTRGEV
jgi:hypothetical protein